MPKPFPGFNACLSMMRKANPHVREEGFDYLLPHASEYIPELIAEFRSETDAGMRWWLIELIGEAKSPDAFPFLVEHLADEDAFVRQWALRGLRKLDTKEARVYLSTHQNSLPNDTLAR